MSKLSQIKQKIALDQFEFSKHAVNQSIIRDISVDEVKETVNQNA